MIIEEQDIAEVNKQESLKLQKILSNIKLPKHYYFDIGKEPYYNFELMHKKLFSSSEVGFLYLFRDEIIIYVYKNKLFNKIKPLFKDSNLKFKIKY